MIKKKLARILIKIYKTVGKYFCKIQKDKIVFLSFSGNYECNPKWICEEMLRQGIQAKYIWALHSMDRFDEQHFPDAVKPMDRYKLSFFRELASARVIIDNGINTSYIKYPKKKGQYLIETWHGSIGIKRFDAETNKDESWVKKMLVESAMTDYIISNSSFETQLYRSTFWKDIPVWEYGHARNDILLRKDEEADRALDRRVRARFGIAEDKKIFLYAPTFRDDKDLRPYTIDYERLMATLSQRFGGAWVIAVRFHVRIRNLLADHPFPQGVYNVSDYADIQELARVIDAGMTDYSSWICEYMLTRKPGFLFATDADRYEVENRAFLFPLEELPFPLAKTQEELFDRIREFDEAGFVVRCDRVLAEKGSVDRGDASARIVEEIKKLMDVS